jgi:tripartite-type tricarboxylate transporter receptor subunit TctC
MVDQGSARALAVNDRKRSSSLADVPTAVLRGREVVNQITSSGKKTHVVPVLVPQELVRSA